MSVIRCVLITMITWLFHSLSLQAQYSADLRMGPTSDGFFLLKQDDRESNVRRKTGAYLSLSLKKNIHKSIFVRYGVEFRQFNAGLNYMSTGRRPSDAFDLDFQVSYLSAIVGIEDGIWVRETFSLSAQFAVIPSYQLVNRISGDFQGWQMEDQDSGIITDFHLGLRPGLLFHYRLSTRLSILTEAALTIHPTSFLEGHNPFIMAHHFGFGIGLAADLDHFRKD